MNRWCGWKNATGWVGYVIYPGNIPGWIHGPFDTVEELKSKLGVQ